MGNVLNISTTKAKQIVDVTDRINVLINKTKMLEGLCALFVSHTTAALTTGEVGEGTG